MALGGVAGVALGDVAGDRCLSLGPKLPIWRGHTLSLATLRKALPGGAAAAAHPTGAGAADSSSPEPPTAAPGSEGGLHRFLEPEQLAAAAQALTQLVWRGGDHAHATPPDT